MLLRGFSYIIRCFFRPHNKLLLLVFFLRCRLSCPWLIVSLHESCSQSRVFYACQQGDDPEKQKHQRKYRNDDVHGVPPVGYQSPDPQAYRNKRENDVYHNSLSFFFYWLNIIFFSIGFLILLFAATPLFDINGLLKILHRLVPHPLRLVGKTKTLIGPHKIGTEGDRLQIG